MMKMRVSREDMLTKVLNKGNSGRISTTYFPTRSRHYHALCAQILG